MLPINHRRALIKTYARASLVVFDRVAFALLNLGMGEQRWKIIRNFLCTARTVRERYVILRSLLNALTQ